jgi:rfaE bifunctional protein nucleotidyltransferase chain/domain
MPERVVLANGCFDPLHYGHLRHLEAARAMGDALVVAVTSDAEVRKEKGALRPLFAQNQRAAMLAALRCVDRVLVVDSALGALRAVAPQVFVKGCDYSIETVSDEVLAYCRKRGIEIRFTTTAKWSATEAGRVLRRG